MEYGEILRDTYSREYDRAVRLMSYELLHDGREGQTNRRDFCELMRGNEACDERSAPKTFDAIQARAWDDVHKNLWKVFMHRDKRLAAYALQGERVGEERKTIALLARERNCRPEDIRIIYRER